MKNILKIYILFIIIMLVFTPYIKASSVNMNLDYNIDNSYESEPEIDNNAFDNSTNTSGTSSNSPTVTTDSSNNDFLTIENILSIIIIVIGIILIFLGIAIIIRCKQ